MHNLIFFFSFLTLVLKCRFPEFILRRRTVNVVMVNLVNKITGIETLFIDVPSYSLSSLPATYPRALHHRTLRSSFVFLLCRPYGVSINGY